MKILTIIVLSVTFMVAYGNNLFDGEEVINPKLQPIGHEEAVNSDDGDEELDVEPDIQEEEDDDDDDEADQEDEANDDEEEEEAAEGDEEASEEEEAAEEEEEDESSEDDEDSPPEDLCADVTCKPGRECVVLDGEAKCRCISECPAVQDNEEKICGSDNVTYASKCDLYRTKCLYHRDHVKQAKHLRIEYYGPCIEILPCSEFEMSEFPSRMRAWLKNIYLQLYDEDDEDTGLSYEQRNQGRKLAANRERVEGFERQSIDTIQRDFARYMPLYRYPVHWKFLTLDNDPADKYLSRTEMEPLLGTLIPMEHCAKEFFKNADVDKDHMISLYEWGMALGLEKEDMDLTMTL